MAISILQKITWKNFFWTLLTLGGTLAASSLVFTGMLAVCPSVILAVAAFLLNFGVDGEVYRQAIGGAVERVSSKNYSRRNIVRNFLTEKLAEKRHEVVREFLLKNLLADLPPALAEYKGLLAKARLSPEEQKKIDDIEETFLEYFEAKHSLGEDAKKIPHLSKTSAFQEINSLLGGNKDHDVVSNQYKDFLGNLESNEAKTLPNLVKYKILLDDLEKVGEDHFAPEALKELDATEEAILKYLEQENPTAKSVGLNPGAFGEIDSLLKEHKQKLLEQANSRLKKIRIALGIALIGSIAFGVASYASMIKEFPKLAEVGIPVGATIPLGGMIGIGAIALFAAVGFALMLYSKIAETIQNYNQKKVDETLEKAKTNKAFAIVALLVVGLVATATIVSSFSWGSEIMGSEHLGSLSVALASNFFVIPCLTFLAFPIFCFDVTNAIATVRKFNFGAWWDNKKEELAAEWHKLGWSKLNPFRILAGFITSISNGALFLGHTFCAGLIADEWDKVPALGNAIIGGTVDSLSDLAYLLPDEKKAHEEKAAEDETKEKPHEVENNLKEEETVRLLPSASSNNASEKSTALGPIKPAEAHSHVSAFLLFMLAPVNFIIFTLRFVAVLCEAPFRNNWNKTWNEIRPADIFRGDPPKEDHAIFRHNTLELTKKAHKAFFEKELTLEEEVAEAPSWWQTFSKDNNISAKALVGIGMILGIATFCFGFTIYTPTANILPIPSLVTVNLWEFLGILAGGITFSGICARGMDTAVEEGLKIAAAQRPLEKPEGVPPGTEADFGSTHHEKKAPPQVVHSAEDAAAVAVTTDALPIGKAKTA